SNKRKEVAKSLETQVIGELNDLNFKDAEIRVRFSEIPFTEIGTDEVEFMFMSNKGSDLKPMAKIASGGEVSRIMLAFKNVIGKYDEIQTVIFDEIDTGISGETAEIVGKKLKEISTHRQVISITHLPQIAVFGDNNYSIKKSSDAVATYTTIEGLDTEGKVQEIARLLSGAAITTQSIDNAKTLIEATKQ
ncbi:MAG: DNA repair protein RecN, partial [Anaerovoracaceae bacterium]